MLPKMSGRKKAILLLPRLRLVQALILVVSNQATAVLIRARAAD